MSHPSTSTTEPTSRRPRNASGARSWTVVCVGPMTTALLELEEFKKALEWKMSKKMSLDDPAMLEAFCTSVWRRIDAEE